MHEHTNEQISQFLDNELAADEALTLMRQVLLDSALKNKLLRYEAIGHALKTETFIAPRADFLDRIHQEIEHDPVYLLPQRKQAKFKPQHKILALVASAALVAVILPKDITRINGSQMKASSSGIHLAQQQQRRSENVIKQLPHSELMPLNAQINDYLQTHNKNANVASNTDAASIAKITAYGQK
ncbi:putative Negative regulator of sigma E activity [Crenothrix polyspora]|uniref:Putative Negative regulator of sigma E activity n=1 Tax=Crenothrix polyspora TaxID=360316 RepID=A0A1R4H7G1_9GAMM|nr:sigma-E factor negative regulatory protein [Crenothrix polyspora]SJM92215.1 putative Negative regulator of sigma E activity [Crenothrix polyspora]